MLPSVRSLSRRLPARAFSVSSRSGPPVNISKFIQENRSRLQPPVGNAMLFDGRSLKVMLVGGPNARSDYHIEKGEELFVQLKGNVHIDVVESRKPKRLSLHDDNLLILPSGIPHSPQRYSNTVGLVIERTRRSDEKDCLRWYAPQSGHGAELEVAYEETFHCTDLGTQIKEVIERYLTRDASLAAESSSGASPLDEYFAASTPSNSFTHFNHTIAGGTARGPAPHVARIACSEEFRVHVIQSPSPSLNPSPSSATADPTLTSSWVPIASREVFVWQVEGSAVAEFAVGGGAVSEVALRRGDALLRRAEGCRLNMVGTSNSRTLLIENIAPVE